MKEAIVIGLVIGAVMVLDLFGGKAVTFGLLAAAMGTLAVCSWRTANVSSDEKKEQQANNR